MQAIRTSWKRLPRGSSERAIAKLAHIANVNTVQGGASALVKANRALAMGLPHADEMADAVDATYSASTGKPSPAHSAWECRECGSVHLGQEAADECCADVTEEMVSLEGE